MSTAEADAAMINGHNKFGARFDSESATAEADAAMINGHVDATNNRVGVATIRGGRRGDDQWTRYPVC